MNVLQIVPELNLGGVERGTIDLAKRLAEDGHKSIVISAGGRLEEKLNFPGIKHYKLPVHRKSPFTIFNLISKLTWIIKNEEIDIIHARSRVPAIISFFAYRKYVSQRSLEKQNPVSFITTCHGYYSIHIFSRIMGYGKLVIVPSNIIGRHMNIDFGVPIKSMRLIPRGVNINEFSYRKPDLKKSSDFNIGIVGRITPLKGHEDFFKAMSKVVRVYPKTKIIVAGSVGRGKDDYKRKLDLLIKLLGIERHVEFVGLVDDVPGLMHKLDLLVLATTAQEAFGRVIIEAFACGTPVLATAVGGVTDIISNMENGMLVPPHQPYIMAKQTKNILTDRKLAIRLSFNARKSVEQKYSLRKMLDSTIEVYRESQSIFKILIIKTSAIGDIILGMAGIRAIREKFKNADIYVVTSLMGREILSKSGFVDEVIVCQLRKNKKISYKHLFDFSKKLRQIGFDISIDLQNNKKSHFLSYLSGAPKRYGYKTSKWDFFLNHQINQPKIEMGPIEHQGYFLKEIGIEKIKTDIKINIPGKEQEYIDKLLSKEWLKNNELLVALNPFASIKWQTKIWPLKKYAELIDKLAQNNVRTVITGDNSVKDLIYKLCQLTYRKPIVLAGKTTILQLAALFKRCEVIITPDSAPLHLATAVNTPCIALFGPTNPSKHIPKDANVKVLRKDLPCVPCYKKTCSDVQCMEKISVDEVLDEVLKQL